jgi:hypothetical protein
MPGSYFFLRLHLRRNNKRRVGLAAATGAEGQMMKDKGTSTRIQRLKSQRSFGN